MKALKDIIRDGERANIRNGLVEYAIQQFGKYPGMGMTHSDMNDWVRLTLTVITDDLHTETNQGIIQADGKASGIQ